jgi:CheY-like chemotaxis protein
MTPLRILVVDDDAVIGLLLAEMLEGMGHQICAVEVSEADTVSATTRCRPDMMIVDVQLGEGNGIAAVQRILCDRPVPHVFVSGNPACIRGLGSVALQKPFREGDLAHAMELALAQMRKPS